MVDRHGGFDRAHNGFTRSHGWFNDAVEVITRPYFTDLFVVGFIDEAVYQSHDSDEGYVAIDGADPVPGYDRYVIDESAWIACSLERHVVYLVFHVPVRDGYVGSDALTPPGFPWPTVSQQGGCARPIGRELTSTMRSAIDAAVSLYRFHSPDTVNIEGLYMAVDSSGSLEQPPSAFGGIGERDEPYVYHAIADYLDSKGWLNESVRAPEYDGQRIVAAHPMERWLDWPTVLAGYFYDAQGFVDPSQPRGWSMFDPGVSAP